MFFLLCFCTTKLKFLMFLIMAAFTNTVYKTRGSH